jgi:putative N6-adenine-specific DNA methylase
MSELFVTCPQGFEPLLTNELVGLGISNIRHGFRGVYVPLEMENVYKINYASRLATRVLWPLAHFPCRDREDLYAQAKKIRWNNFLTAKKTFSIDANVHHPALRNSLFAALVVKDAICDQLRERSGERPSIDLKNPDIQLNLFINQGFATISFDTSGAPLYKRGYREYTAIAPLQESIAAAILILGNYSTDEIFCDPFCGSGTILIEAAMQATHTPAGFFRNQWGFFQAPLFSETAWQEVKRAFDDKRIYLEKGKIIGSDKDIQAAEMTRAHIKACGFAEQIEVSHKDIRSYFPTLKPTLIVTNPPYGKRLKANEEIYRMLGTFIKERCAPAVKAYALCPTEGLIRETDLKVQDSFPITSGGLDVSLFSLSH